MREITAEDWEQDHQETWLLRDPRDRFRIEVKHWKWGYRARVVTGRTHNWNMYIDIPADSWLFREIMKDGLDTDLVHSIPLHGGITLSDLTYAPVPTYTTPDPVILTPRPPAFLRLGCDYMHYGDDRFSLMSNAQEAKEVFDDAVDLFYWMLGLMDAREGLLTPPPHTCGKDTDEQTH